MKIRDLIAAVVRRFVKVGLVGLGVAALPTGLLWLQLGRMDRQNELVKEQNQFFRDQNKAITEQFEQTAADTRIVRRAQLLQTLYDCEDGMVEVPVYGDDGRWEKNEDGTWKTKEEKQCVPAASARARYPPAAGVPIQRTECSKTERGSPSRHGLRASGAAAIR